MTSIKSAVVNGHLLSFFCLQFSVAEDINCIEELRPGVFEPRVREQPLHLWKFMRFHSPNVTRAQERSLAGYTRLREDIQSTLAAGRMYPWVALTRLSSDWVTGCPIYHRL